MSGQQIVRIDFTENFLESEATLLKPHILIRVGELFTRGFQIHPGWEIARPNNPCYQIVSLNN